MYATVKIIKHNERMELYAKLLVKLCEVGWLSERVSGSWVCSGAATTTATATW